MKKWRVYWRFPTTLEGTWHGTRDEDMDLSEALQLVSNCQAEDKKFNDPCIYKIATKATGRSIIITNNP